MTWALHRRRDSDRDRSAVPAPGSAPHGAARLMRLATAASVTVAMTLIAVKVVTWLMTDSISVLSSLVDSVMDAMASLINLVAVRHALQPADREHRFGHGKAEPLAALGQAAFIAGSAAFLAIEAVGRLLSPRPIEHAGVGIAVMAFAIVVTVGLVALQRYVVRKTGSTAIGADALHYETDVLVNGSVIVSLVLTSWLGWYVADPLFGFAIALYLVRGAWKISRRALDLLMDREFADEERADIRGLVLAHPKVKGMHDLRTRRAGIQPFIQLHLELDGEMTLHEAHDIADEVEAR
ncbi:MAG: cation diffusion facilitator family transporter, partial [Alphaproteobacteria bacterium]